MGWLIESSTRLIGCTLVFVVTAIASSAYAGDSPGCANLNETTDLGPGDDYTTPKYFYYKGDVIVVGWSMGVYMDIQALSENDQVILDSGKTQQGQYNITVGNANQYLYFIVTDVDTMPDYGITINCQARPGLSHDMNADGRSDIVLQDSAGDAAVWFMTGAQPSSTLALGRLSNWSLVGQSDFNGDGFADLLWRDGNGNTAIWFFGASGVSSTASLGNIPTAWSVVATGDFNGDGKGDILWQDDAGDLAVWLMNGATVLASAGLGNVASSWKVVGTGVFGFNNNSDILWRDTSGFYLVYEWYDRRLCRHRRKYTHRLDPRRPW
jgi:FG-GAP-like repeat